MNSLHTQRFALAIGTAWAILSIACMLVLLLLPREAAVGFFNTLTHGVDWTIIMRPDIPLWQLPLSMVEAFGLGWLVGLVLAATYNLSASRASR